MAAKTLHFYYMSSYLKVSLDNNILNNYNPKYKFYYLFIILLANSNIVKKFFLEHTT